MLDLFSRFLAVAGSIVVASMATSTTVAPIAWVPGNQCDPSIAHYDYGATGSPFVVHTSTSASRGAECLGCRVSWNVDVTWAEDGTVGVEFAGTGNDFTVTANQTTHHESGPVDFGCAEGVGFYAVAGPNQFATITYDCSACPGNPQ